MHTPPSSALFPSPLLLIPLLCCLPLLPHGGADSPYLCNAGNYTANSPYESNLRQLLLPYLPSIASASGVGFSTASEGELPDQVWGLALCRGDINATACRTCLDGASTDILQLCPYASCLFKYSDQNFTSSAFDNSEQLIMWNAHNITSGRFPGYTQNATIYDFFNQVVDTLLSNISDSAASNNSNSEKWFAIGELSTTNVFPTIYGFVQCAPDMSGPECRRCLRAQINETRMHWLYRRQVGRILGVWCNLRYEVYPFYEGRPMISLSSAAPGNFIPGTPPPPSTRPGSSPPHPQIRPQSEDHASY